MKASVKDVLAQSIFNRYKQTGLSLQGADAAAEISIANKAKGKVMSTDDIDALVANLVKSQQEHTAYFTKYITSLPPKQQEAFMKQAEKLLASKGTPVSVKTLSGFGIAGFGYDWSGIAKVATSLGNTLVGLAPAAAQLIGNKMALDKTPNIPVVTDPPARQVEIARSSGPISRGSGIMGGPMTWVIGGIIIVGGIAAFFLFRKK